MNNNSYFVDTELKVLPERLEAVLNISKKIMSNKKSKNMHIKVFLKKRTFSFFLKKGLILQFNDLAVYNQYRDRQKQIFTVGDIWNNNRSQMLYLSIVITVIDLTSTSKEPSRKTSKVDYIYCKPTAKFEGRICHKNLLTTTLLKSENSTHDNLAKSIKYLQAIGYVIVFFQKISESIKNLF